MGDHPVLDELRAAHGPGVETYDGAVEFNVPGCVGASNGERIRYRGQTLTYWTSGQDFSAPSVAEMHNAFPTGRKLTKAFLDLCARHKPVYGAILLLDDLGEPVELSRGEYLYGFRDFFLSDTWFDADLRAGVAAMYTDAFVAETSGGLYVSTTPWHNRPGKEVDTREAQERSKKIARLIVRTLRHTHLPRMW